MELRSGRRRDVTTPPSRRTIEGQKAINLGLELKSEQITGAAAVVSMLLEQGITHAVWLVDTESSSMYEALTDAHRAGSMMTVPVCREGESIAIAVGLMLGGKKPVVIMQNTGLFESGDSLRGQAIDLDMPLLMMIGYRGWSADRSLMTDSAAQYLEPVLDAYGVPFWTMTATNFSTLIPTALAEAERRGGPTAILVPAEWAE